MNAHNLNHLIGCYALAMTFGALKWNRLQVILGVMFLGTVWEFIDQLNRWFEWGFSFLDSRGFDWSDILMDFIGVALAVIVGMGVCWYLNRQAEKRYW